MMGPAGSNVSTKGLYETDELRWAPTPKISENSLGVLPLSTHWTEFRSSRVKHNNSHSTKLSGNAWSRVGHCMCATSSPCHDNRRYHWLIILLFPLEPEWSQYQLIEVYMHRTLVRSLCLWTQILLLASVSLWKTQILLFCTTSCYIISLLVN